MTPVILLHGAIGAADQLIPLEEALQAQGHQVYRLSFSGHGRIPLSGGWGIAAFADELAAFITREGLQQPAVFGYSMGGYVALYLALQQPGLLGRIATLATKYDWTPEGAAKESKMLDPENMLAKVPKFAAALEQRHGPEWKTLLAHTATMMQQLGNKPLLEDAMLAGIANEVLVGVGDRDTMVSLAETERLYRALPLAQFYVLPATAHPIEKLATHTLAALLHAFYSK